MDSSVFCLAAPATAAATLFLYPRAGPHQNPSFSFSSSSSSSGSPCKHDALFRIDDLLDFSNCDIGAAEQEDLPASRNAIDFKIKSSNGEYEKYHCMSPSSQNQPYAPCDELAQQLEWLSSLVQESQQDWNFFIPTPALQSTQQQQLRHGIDDNDVVESRPRSEKAVPCRARRSKRLHSCSSSSSSVWSIVAFQHDDSRESKSAASCKKIKAVSPRPSCREPPRRCSHCQVQKTPQWRGGPMGPKTLCNACGVRYKSGRLVTEYRPAGSPTFNIQVHSNSHKKILQMRHRKGQQDTVLKGQSDYELPQEPYDSSKTSDTGHKVISMETFHEPSLS